MSRRAHSIILPLLIGAPFGCGGTESPLDTAESLVTYGGMPVAVVKRENIWPVGYMGRCSASLEANGLYADWEYFAQLSHYVRDCIDIRRYYCAQAGGDFMEASSFTDAVDPYDGNTFKCRDVVSVGIFTNRYTVQAAWYCVAKVNNANNAVCSVAGGSSSTLQQLEAALTLLLQNFPAGLLYMSDLVRISNDPNLSAELRNAAAILANNPAVYSVLERISQANAGQAAPPDGATSTGDVSTFLDLLRQCPGYMPR